MALTELQQPAKSDFYQNCRTRTSTWYNTMNTLKAMAEFLARMDATTLNNMAVPASGSDEGLRADLIDLRAAVNETLDFYEGTATTQTVIPKDVINKIRSM
jgi:hypothetical protein